MAYEEVEREKIALASIWLKEAIEATRDAEQLVEQALKVLNEVKEAGK